MSILKEEHNRREFMKNVLIFVGGSLLPVEAAAGENKLEEIVRGIESKIKGLKFEELPEVRDMSEYPKLKEIKEQNGKLALMGMEIGGLYCKEDGKIYMNEKCLSDKGKIAHELGHYVVYQILKKKGLEKGFFPASWDVIDEGIAECFRSCFENMGDDFKDREYPTGGGYGSLNARLKYSGGYHLIKPIIEKYGIKGVEALIDSVPPKMGELLRFRESIMKSLGN